MNQQTPLTVERWKRLEVIFHQASELREPARSALLADLCGTDTLFRAEVQELLESFDAQTDDEFPAAASSAVARTLAGTRLGRYRLIGLLGQGGMSSVYLACRDDGQFDQKVAIKLMSPHLADEFFTERFRRERQILADLDHPNTTRLIDGGVSANGDPYLVMEFVDGQPFDEYCDKRRLTVAERIQLILQICSAVEYAHARQIVHRDLKPGNILVTGADVPKLLDFGTAKLLSPLSAESTTTRFGMMTLRYASPEQLCGSSLTAATDIYSLGIVLYETVTGVWPFGNPQSVIAGLDRAVHDVKPAPVSKVISDDAAAARSLSRLQLVKVAEGGLERIMEKALQPKPENRYASVGQFAVDLQLFLDGKPVATAARVPWHRSRVARWAFAAAAAAIVCLLLVKTFQRRTEDRVAARSLAVLPFVNAGADAKAQYVADGLTEDITDELARTSSLRVIDRASASRFTEAFPDLTDVGRQLHVAFVLTGSVDHSQSAAKVYAQLQRTPGGEKVWAAAYPVDSVTLPRVYAEIASGVSSVLHANTGVAARQTAPVVNDQAYDLTLQAAHEMQQPTVAAYAQAENELRQAIQLDPHYARAYYLLGVLKSNLGNVRGNSIRTEAERTVAVAMWRKALELAPDYNAPRSQLASYAIQYDWDWALAERELRRVLAAEPDSHAESVYSFLLLYHRRYAEAELHRRTAEDLDPISLTNLTNSSLFWFQAGNYSRGMEACGKLHGAAALTMVTLAYIAQGRPDLASRLTQKADPHLPWTPFGKAVVAASLGHNDEALRLIRPMEAAFPNLRVPRQWFALVYAVMGDEPDTVKWLQRSADAHEWQVLNIAVHPFYRQMQNSPDFRALKRRIGLEQ